METGEIIESIDLGELKMEKSMSLKNKRGFTLVELVVVVGIIGVLAAIAIPLYTRYKANSYRSAAKAAMVEGAQNMERYFTRFNSYDAGIPDSPTLGDPAAGDQVLATTGRYTLTLATPPVDLNGDGDTTDPGEANAGFVITAIPVVTDSCGNLTINQAGVKTPANCW